MFDKQCASALYTIKSETLHFMMEDVNSTEGYFILLSSAYQFLDTNLEQACKRSTRRRHETMKTVITASGRYGTVLTYRKNREIRDECGMIREEKK